MRWECATVLALAGCAPTYAPPLRSPHLGAPARAREGDVVLGGAAVAVGPDVPRYGGPSLAYGVRDWVSVEGGADFGNGDWMMGFGGARFTHAPRRYSRYHYAADLETALGLGWGGSLCGNNNDGSCPETDSRGAAGRIAGGGLLGLGVAGHFDFFAIYARSRVQLTRAAHVPTTLWGTLGIGLQFRIAETVDLYAQPSFAGYTNRIDAVYGFIWELGVAVRIPTLR